MFRPPSGRKHRDRTFLPGFGDVPLTLLSARFFLELAVGLMLGPLLLDRRPLGLGFQRMMAAIALGVVLPAAFLLKGSEELRIAFWLTVGFSGLLVLLIAVPASSTPRAITVLLSASCLVGVAAVLQFVHVQTESASLATLPLFLTSALTSSLVLGLVTGAMILGHWYLVTPDLPIGLLDRITRFSLASLYVKAALFTATVWLFFGRFEVSVRGFGSAFGIGEPVATAGFQPQLDFIFLLARVAIGLIGPAVLCHMTLKTVELKATQPATGILYAATILVLMGELFAFLGEGSFEVIL